VFEMKLRRHKMDVAESEEDFDQFAHAKVVGFHPHCYMQPLALAESKQCDELYALEHNPVLGDDEEEA